MLHQWDRDESAMQQMEEREAGDSDRNNVATFGEGTSAWSYYEVTFVKTGAYCF